MREVLHYLGALCVLRGENCREFYAFFTAAVIAEAVTVERGIAIG